MQHSFSQQFKSTNTRYNYFITMAKVGNTSYFSHFSHFHSSPWGLPASKVSLKRKIHLRVGLQWLPHGLSLTAEPVQHRQVKKYRQNMYKEIEESTFGCPTYLFNYKTQFSADFTKGLQRAQPWVTGGAFPELSGSYSVPKAGRLGWKFSAFSFPPFQSHLHSTLPEATIILLADSSS